MQTLPRAASTPEKIDGRDLGRDNFTVSDAVAESSLAQVPMKVFDDLTDVYEAMIDWPQRLANEGPFYRRCFERVGAAASPTWPAARGITPRCSTPGISAWKAPTSVRR